MTFNHIVPRFGATYDLTGDGKTVLKANWGRFYFNPGVNLADAVNPNTSDQYADYNWNDLNGDRIFQEGEAAARSSRAFGGTASAAIDPNLENPYTDEASFFVERARAARPRRPRRLRLEEGQRRLAAFNAARPFERLQRPGHRSSIRVRTASLGNGDDGPALRAAQPRRHVARLERSVTTNIHGYEGTYKTLEFSANKRYGNRWSMNASYSYTWTQEFGNIYFNNRFGTAVPADFSLFGSLPAEPERADAQRVHQLEREGLRARWTPAGACASRRC